LWAGDAFSGTQYPDPKSRNHFFANFAISAEARFAPPGSGKTESVPVSTTSRRGIGRALAAVACVLAATAIAVWLGAATSDAANRRCAPVVSAEGPGLTKASVLIVSGRVDCEKSREVIFKALSVTPYERLQLKGWDCTSTAEGGSGVFGARCTAEGEKGEEVIRSTLPRRCSGCNKLRD
jgi:hypothetical protein